MVDVTPVKGPTGKFQIPQTAIDSVNRNGIGLKGPLMTPVGKGHQSLNLALRKYVLCLGHLLMLYVYYNAVGFCLSNCFNDQHMLC